MAARNYGRFLSMAVRSVMAQSFGGWELIVIDDGSTDETPIVMRGFQNQRIRYIAADRLGQSRAKNLGVRLARGEFIAFLDADDAWQPTKLAIQIALIDSKPGVGVVATRRSMIDDSVMDIPPIPAASGCAEVITADDLFIRNPVCFSSVLVRREVFDRVGGFDENLDLSIDYDLWLRVAACYQFLCLPEQLTLYRTGHGNLSRKQSDRIATAFTIMRRRHRGISPKALAAGFASTHHSLGWLFRRSHPLRSMAAYARAMRYPWGRLSSIKGLLASTWNVLQYRSEPLTAENCPANR